MLIVDDDKGVREYVTQVLVRAGYDVQSVHDGEEATLFLKKCPVPVVVLDLFMPKMGGFQTLTFLRQNYPGTKIIAISGDGNFPSGDALVVAARIGAHKTLLKPFTPSQLLDEVHALLSPHRPAK